eukprot:4608812-Pyramimonas_sp.AAC.1
MPQQAPDTGSTTPQRHGETMEGETPQESHSPIAPQRNDGEQTQENEENACQPSVVPSGCANTTVNPAIDSQRAEDSRGAN